MEARSAGHRAADRLVQLGVELDAERLPAGAHRHHAVLRPFRDVFRLASLVAKEALDKPAAPPTAVAIMRPLALALFAGAMYLICWGVTAGAQRWGIVFPLGVVALELIVARAIDRRSIAK